MLRLPQYFAHRRVADPKNRLRDLLPQGNQAVDLTGVTAAAGQEIIVPTASTGLDLSSLSGANPITGSSG